MEHRKTQKMLRALTNIFYKIFGRMTNKRLFWYLGNEKKIDDYQFGFRKQRSTIIAISKMTTKILDRFRRKEKTAAIFFDIEKGYDKVNRKKHFNNWETC